MACAHRGHGAPLLSGYIDAIGDLPSNSAGIVDPAGRQVSRYDKIHLVPFGEYVPLGSVLFFAESMVRNVGDFAPGSTYTVSELNNRRVATTICYEDVFPGLVRQFTRLGAEVIVNITNDGWFGETSAPYQHLRMSTVRATENRRYIVRAANTGISAIIDPYGNVVENTRLGERTVLDGVARYRSDRTFYVRFGDVFSYLMAAVTLGSVALPARGNAWRSVSPGLDA
jgi:apolipoprotein N-acyltransferase